MSKKPGGRPANTDRQNALALGYRTYTGSPHAKCGTTERYVSGGGCVHCARVTATEQRDALKYLKAHAAPGYDEAEAAASGFEPVNDVADNPDDPLDSADDDAVEVDRTPSGETDDAEARRLAAIEDLM